MKDYLTQNHFSVEWNGQILPDITEVLGLDIMIDTVDFREGNSRVSSSVAVPALASYPQLSLTRAMVKGNNDFFFALRSTLNGEVQKSNLNIALLDKKHEPVFVWRVRNAFAVAYYGPIFDAGFSAVATERIELAYEGLEVEAVG